MEEIDFGRVFDALPGLVWTAFPDGRADFVNQRWCEYTGLSFDEARGDGWQGAVHPDDRSRLVEAWLGFTRSGQAGEIEARLRRFDGAYRWFVFRFSPLADSSGQIAKWCGINTDIEDRVRAEQAQRALDRRAQLILDGLPAHVMFMTADGELEGANQYSLSYFGRTLEELKSLRVGHSYHPDDRAEVLATWRRSVESGEPCSFEARSRRGDGVYRWLHTLGFPLRNDEGGIDVWYILSLDVSERRASEERLRQANAYLTEAQRIGRSGSFTWDVIADDHDWSEEVYRIFGLDAGVRVNVELLQTVIHPDDLGEVGRVIAGAAQGRNFDLTFRIVGADGALKHAHVVAHRIEDRSGRPVFLGAVQDITESKLAEEALDRVRSELAYVARVATLNAMTASIAHEVNQPLSGIRTNASTSLRLLAADPPNAAEASKAAQRTIRDADRASEVIRRLRAMFSKDAPSLELINLNEAAREVVALSATELRHGRVVLQTDLADDLPLVSADRVQLQQVILNLLLNAGDAMATIEDRPRALLLRTDVEAGGGVRLSVRDSGPGIPTEAADKLFEAFHTTKAHGMGVGLSISRSIIERHDGRIWGEANDGPGATFSFCIPGAPKALLAAQVADESKTSRGEAR